MVVCDLRLTVAEGRANYTLRIPCDPRARLSLHCGEECFTAGRSMNSMTSFLDDSNKARDLQL